MARKEINEIQNGKTKPMKLKVYYLNKIKKCETLTRLIMKN